MLLLHAVRRCWTGVVVASALVDICIVLVIVGGVGRAPEALVLCGPETVHTAAMAQVAVGILVLVLAYGALRHARGVVQLVPSDALQALILLLAIAGLAGVLTSHALHLGVVGRDVCTPRALRQALICVCIWVWV